MLQLGFAVLIDFTKNYDFVSVGSETCAQFAGGGIETFGRFFGTANMIGPELTGWGRQTLQLTDFSPLTADREARNRLAQFLGGVRGKLQLLFTGNAGLIARGQCCAVEFQVSVDHENVSAAPGREAVG